MAFQRASSSVRSHPKKWKYEVFLSFRGEDTRNSFTSHLHHALCQKGIYTFMDEEELPRGELISPSLLHAIEESKISIIVLSRNYATSKSCLDELVKILECKASKGQMVIPIFYAVDPSEIRNEKGSFGEAIAGHEEEFRDNDVKRVQKWRAALHEASNLSGWCSENWHESKLVDKIVQYISSKLKRRTLNVAKHPVGLDPLVHDVLLLLSTELDDIGMVGICGIGGIGKTTLAKAVFNSVIDQFEGISFIANVREIAKRRNGLVQLQERLLSDVLASSQKIRVNNVHEGVNLLRDRLCHIKVLLVLDDVDQLDQLESLAGDCSWFGPGSRIITTTRDEHLLVAHGVEKVYKVKELNSDDSLQLFSSNAFRKLVPPKEYEGLSFRVLNYAKGLPLALIVLGSFLCGRSIPEWKSTLSKLKTIPNKQIYETLRISFDGLEDHEKAIFLDIACFFKGKDKEYVIKILNNCELFADSGVSVLIDKSLVTVESGELWMHDLIQEMGSQIVRQESIDKPGKRSRLWFHEDVRRVLTENMGTEAIEGIKLDFPEQERVLLVNPDAFTKMKKLRLLIVRNADISGSHLDFLSNELRLLDWPGYPFSSLPSNFGPNKLVAVDLSYSRVNKLIMCFKMYKNLTSVNLSFCKLLEEIPDFSTIPNLESLILDHCTSLKEVHPSVGSLEKLVTLSLRQCFNLRRLPSDIRLRSLRHLFLVGCSKLKNFPNIVEKMEFLKELYLEGTALKELPSSIENLVGLECLYLELCRNLEVLPNSIHKLQNLLCLGLNGCSKLRQIPDLSPNLLYLSASDCRSLESIPKFNAREATRFSYHLDLTNCKKLVKYQADDIANMLITSEGHVNATVSTFSGSNIPEWFSHHSPKGAISFEVPSNLYAKPMSLSFYVLFGPKDVGVETGRFICGIEIIINNKTMIAEKRLFQSVESDHVWLRSTLPCPWRWQLNRRLWTRFDVSFTAHGVPMGSQTRAVLKKCGFHLAYKQDGHLIVPGTKVRSMNDI